MSIQAQIDRIALNIESAYSAASSKGANVPDSKNSDNLTACINSIEFITIRSGAGEPDNSVGNDGDIYLLMG